MSTGNYSWINGLQKFFIIMLDGGPQFGNIRRPFMADRIITSGATVPVGEFDTCIMVKKTSGSPTTVTLPDVSVWLTQPWGIFPVIIKDAKGDAATNNITITPFAGQTIDGLTSLTIAGDYASVCLRPLSDLSGWAIT
jgi:hypothetical protein